MRIRGETDYGWSLIEFVFRENPLIKETIVNVEIEILSRFSMIYF